jgi:NAD(P) transhydrogenase subunit alpha
MPVVIGAVREIAPNETRVALVPEVASKLIALGARVMMERGAGARAQFPDAGFKGVEFVDSAVAVQPYEK